MSETLDDLFAAYEQAVREDSEEWKAEFRRRIEGVLRVEAEAARPSRAAEPLDVEMVARALHAGNCKLSRVAFHSCHFRDAHRKGAPLFAAEYACLREKAEG